MKNNKYLKAEAAKLKRKGFIALKSNCAGAGLKIMLQVQRNDQQLNTPAK